LLRGASPAAAWAQDASAKAPQKPQSQASSPEITSGHLQPLLESNVARPMRYRPIPGGYEIENGSEFFNRPLYGPNIPFRADGGDRPEFSLYLPGHGGNLRLGIETRGHATWLHACERVIARYVEGRVEYEVYAPSLGSGQIRVQALTLGAALWIRVEGVALPADAFLLFAFGGVSGRKGKRNGDIGCEDQPVSEFFHLRPQECSGNQWTIDGPNLAAVQARAMKLRVDTTAAAELRLGDAAAWDRGCSALWSSTSSSPAFPVLLGRTSLDAEPVHLAITVLEGARLPVTTGGAAAHSATTVSALAFAARRAELATIANSVQWTTPDEFLNSTAPALNLAADAIWDEELGCVMHGAVAWRMPLAGWRGPYSLDVLGRHDRMRRHLRHWIARQNHDAVTNGSSGEPSTTGFVGIASATGAPDTGSHGARTENLLHSAGDLSHNHYDMNLVFFDALLRHLRWTGDVDFAREAWPALELHAAWERRLFRREYGSAQQSAPLYEAYAAIWASDNLQYNGGGATHSSAYNVYLNRAMAELAVVLGKPKEVADAYRVEADAIVRAMREHLWMPERGAFAESRDWLAERQLAESPAVWTMYQALDSEVPTERDGWQLAAEQLHRLRKVPIRGAGVPVDAGWQIACSDWMPYVWSLTLLVMAENLGTALGFYQAGMADEGYALLRGTLVDAGFRGLCPGNFPMSLQLDPHRQESQRDFGDPIGCASRVLVEGMWGIQPDLLRGRLTLRPQLPRTWTKASLKHPDLHIEFQRENSRESWHIVSRFSRPTVLSLLLPGRGIAPPHVLLDGHEIETRFAAGSVGSPRLELRDLPPAMQWKVEIEWRGAAPLVPSSEAIRCRIGSAPAWPHGAMTGNIDDPQGCLSSAGHAAKVDRHTVFLEQREAAYSWWLPVELDIITPQRQPLRLTRGGAFEPVPLDSLLTGQVREILTRDTTSPRPGLCSLNLPTGLLGGWADFDAKAEISDAGLRSAGGAVRLPGGLAFLTPAATDAPNCCFLSHWSIDKPQATLELHGRAQRLHLLLAGTTFPQATGSPHAEVSIAYGDGKVQHAQLTNPSTWWPVEQDYLVDDYLFCMRPSADLRISVPWRLDLATGNARPTDSLSQPGRPGAKVHGGSAFVVSIEIDATSELRSISLHTRLYGVVLGWLGLTMERA
jgi:hypothetical protein